jgi:hypothetical protein
MILHANMTDLRNGSEEQVSIEEGMEAAKTYGFYCYSECSVKE